MSSGIEHKPAGRLALTCDVGAPIPGLHYSDTHGPGYDPRPTACGQPAVIVILSEFEAIDDHGDVEEVLVRADPLCSDHAPEEVHEMRCSSSEEEFLVLDLPVPNDPNALYPTNQEG